MRNVVIIIGILLLSTSTIDASCSHSWTSHFNGNGNPEYPNSGYMYAKLTCYNAGNNWENCDYYGQSDCQYDTQGHKINYTCIATATIKNLGGSPHGAINIGYCWESSHCNAILFLGGEGSAHTTKKCYTDVDAYIFIDSGAERRSTHGTEIIYVDIYGNMTYNITGTFTCVSNVSIYAYLNSTYEKINTTEQSPYSFKIFDGMQYKLVFSDGHEYEFTCNTSDVQYDYDACEHTTINILDNCYNLLISPHIVVEDRDQSMKLVYDGYDNPVIIDMSTNNINDGDVLSISWLTEAGRVDKNVFAHPNYTQNVYDPIISWNLNVIVTNDTSTPIEDAKVHLVQDCSICNGTRFGYTNNNGSIVFNCLEGDSFILNVQKSGYDTYNASINLSTTAQCLDYGVNIKLSGNNSITNLTNDTQTNVWFTDPSGNVVDQVNDTCSYVDLHYQIYRYDDEAMDLEFQYDEGTYWNTIQIHTNIPNGTSTYYRIWNVDFSTTGLYRGWLYNYENDIYDQTAKLRVVNESNKSTSHLENLTSFCWIWNTEYDGKIDYHEDVECIIYANSTNSSLMSITTKFYEDSTLKDTKTLNWADFVNGDPQFYYRWYPSCSYQNDHNYTLKIYGYDDTLLDTDSAYTESIRGLKLTIHVVDDNNNPLDHAYCYVEGWGSLYTDYDSYAIMKGLNPGSYHYRAEKGGYRSTGWATVNITDDESVTYTLYKDTVEHAARMDKMDIKALFYPFMFVLLIVILMGGLIHAFD